MKQFFYSFCVITFGLLPLFCRSQTCTTCTQSFPVSSNATASISVPSGSTYCITGTGTFTGQINALPLGATLCVASTVTFNPSFIVNGISGTFNLNGSSNLPAIVAGSSLTINNTGKACSIANVGINTGIINVAITNSSTGAMLFTSNLVLDGAGSSVTNHGLMRCLNGQFQIGENTTLTNDGDLRVSGFVPNGTSAVSHATIVNNGLINVSNAFILDQYVNFTNNCRLIGNAGFINNNNSTLTNNGIVYMTSGQFTNNGTIIMGGATTAVRGVDFTNNGNGTTTGRVQGSGKMYFTGSTTQQGGFAGTSSGAPLLFYDNTSTANSIFDTPSGTAPANTTNTSRPASMVPPDTAITSTYACNTNFQALEPVVLPIQLISFSYNSSATLPALQWVVNEDNEVAGYEVEQSSDGINFSTTGMVNASNLQTYKYDLNNSTIGNYYRLKIVSKDGVNIYSQILFVGKASQNTISLQSISGTHNVWLNSNVANQGNVTVRFYNILGQLFFTKAFQVVAGNQQQIVALPQQIKGMVVGEISTDKTSVAQKILLQ